MARESRHACGYLTILTIVLANVAYAELPVECGDLTNGYGPYDYTDPEVLDYELPVVENNHFNSDVQHLIKGVHAATLEKDLDYTLRAFPNHHLALYSTLRYHTDPDAQRRPRMRYSARCYFLRAIEWRPLDPVVRLLYGMYLIKLDQQKEAAAEIRLAAKLGSPSPEFHYNLGLSLLNLGDVKEARDHAEIAYAGGYPLPGLRTRLQELDAW